MVSEVARAAEEAREEVEGIVALARAVALLVLLNAIVAVLVVDFACLLNAEDVIGFGDCDELLVGGVVPTETC